MIRFQNLEALHWLWAVVLAAAALAYGAWRRRRMTARLLDAPVRPAMTATAGTGRRAVRGTLLVGGLLLLVAALLDPRWGVYYEEVPQRGIDLFVVVDASRSMLARDARPDRLGRAKQFVQDLLDRLGGDRVGLVAAAGAPSLASPLTVDYGAVRLALDEITPERMARGGSLLGDAVRLAGESFTDDLPEHKAIVVFSDGEDHGSFPVEAARSLFEEHGIRVYTVGIGDPGEGARIPVGDREPPVYLTYEGREVWSKLEPSVLRDMALAGGGAYIPVETGTVDMDGVYEQYIAPATQREFGATRLRLRHARYQWFAGAALILLLLESWIGERRSKREVIR